MALANFNSTVCNYSTEVVPLSAVSGTSSINTHAYVDLVMRPLEGYYLDINDFGYESNIYVDYVVFLQDGDNLKARAYLKDFIWPYERVDLEVPIVGCARKIAVTTSTTTTTTIAPVTTTTTIIVCPGITGYFVNRSIIPLRGETRVLKVYGQTNAEFNYSIYDTTNSASIASGTKTIPSSGFVDISINFALVSSERVFEIVLSTTDPCTLQLQTQPATFNLFQGENITWVGDTYECVQGTPTTTTTTAAPVVTTTTAAPVVTTTTAAPAVTTTTAAPAVTTTTAAPVVTTTTAAPVVTTTTAAPVTTTTTQNVTNWRMDLCSDGSPSNQVLEDVGSLLDAGVVVEVGGTCYTISQEANPGVSATAFSYTEYGDCAECLG